MLPLPPFLVSALREHRARQLRERMRAGALWQDNDLMFPTQAGKPQHAANVWIAFQDRLERPGLAAMRFHDLRHGAATILLANGFTLNEIQEVLGHSTFRMTADICAHLSEDIRQDWGVRMQQAMENNRQLG